MIARIEQLDGCFRFNGNKENIMKFRMETYSSINIKRNENAVFLDTDMLVVRELKEKIILKKISSFVKDNLVVKI